jgi:hypothetical protein
MKLDLARTIADAVLMEGYALYPYRASAPKNRYRWTFGALAPRAWSEAGGCEPWWLETQVLVGGEPSRIAGQLRFFHIERRRTEDASAQPVPALDDGDRLAVPWDEGIVETIDFQVPLDDDYEHVFAVDALICVEPMPNGRVVRERRALTGRMFVRCEPITAEQPLRRVVIRVENTTPWLEAGAPREHVIASAFASTHLLVGVDGGALLSAIDPPAWAATAASTCTSTGTYPVLVGPPGSSDVVLAAPFVMYDHPQLAPESTGDLCDATEIDELLVLRTRTMTDDEKRWARATDPRVAEMIDRADALPPEWMARLHGATRDLHAGEMVPKGVAIGAKVRLRPATTRRTDAQDVLYAGHVATVAAIKHDVDGSTFLAVTIDDDPAAELHGWYGRFHYYRIDEVDLL